MLKPWEFVLFTQKEGEISDADMIKFAGEQVPAMFYQMDLLSTRDGGSIISKVFEDRRSFDTMLLLLPQATAQFSGLEIEIDGDNSQEVICFTPDGSLYSVKINPNTMSAKERGIEAERGCHFQITDSNGFSVGIIGYSVQADGKGQSFHMDKRSILMQDESISIKQMISELGVTTNTTLTANDRRGISLHPAIGINIDATQRVVKLSQHDWTIE